MQEWCESTPPLSELVKPFGLDDPRCRGMGKHDRHARHESMLVSIFAEGGARQTQFAKRENGTMVWAQLQHEGLQCAGWSPASVQHWPRSN